SGTDGERLRTELERLRAEKQAAVDAEAYEDAGKIKQEIDKLEVRLREHAEASEVVVSEQEIADVVAARTGIPVGQLVASELQQLGTLEDDLHRRVIGQDPAVSAVAETVRHARAGLAEPDR